MLHGMTETRERTITLLDFTTQTIHVCLLMMEPYKELA